VGWLLNNGNLDQNDLGKIEVKDFGSYVAVKKDKIKDLIPLIINEKLKKKKVKIQVSN